MAAWKGAIKIVYLKKEYSGFKKIWSGLKSLVYWLGTKLMGVFKDIGAETDIQLLDQDVVKTINQFGVQNSRFNGD